MRDRKVFRQSDLVLQVNDDYDSSILDLHAWDSFLFRLCENRQYQIEAIHNAIIFLASGRYKTTEDLVLENYAQNEILQQRYSSDSEYIKQLQLPKKLSSNIDLATGTGKSYVIYGIAQIMLGLGLVDKVLVLCPSLTIEQGLTEKFRILSGDSLLKEAIPDDAKCKNPAIVDANVTVKKESICVENIHSVYKRTGSSIDDSFKGQGERVLVLNDESHHVFNKVSGTPKEAQGLKRWKEFLLSEDFGFKYILGFTGTAYTDDEYFNDVIYRYSLREAIENAVVKNISYVQEDSSANSNIKFQKIYENHKRNKDRYPKVKPLTIMVTGRVAKAKQLKQDFLEFLSEKENLPIEALEEKVLIVTSNSEHTANISKLRVVDEKDESTEWIISVSMLTEGWDVKNVLQIVPWEDRAFNSKLLVAQVLGRGLRVPEDYKSPPPIVTVFNHDSWSKKIRHLVDEILEIETRIISEIIKDGERKKYNFDVYNLDYTKGEREIDRPERKLFNYTRMEKEGIKLNSQATITESEASFESAVGGYSNKINYLIQHETWSVDKIVNRIYDEFEMRDWEGTILQLGKDQYTQNDLPPRDRVEAIIRKSMDNIKIKGDVLIMSNVNNILSAFRTLLRQKQKSIVIEWEADKPYLIQTEKDMNKESARIAHFRHESATLFYTSNWKNEIFSENQEEALDDVINNEDDYKKSAESEQKESCFKTPVNFVFTNFNPEREFVKRLCSEDNAKMIDAWIKSRDRGFYSIGYSLRYGSKNSKTREYKQLSFNPDFFIKLTRDDIEYILVIEIKSDGDNSPENIAKHKYSKLHFEKLNEKLSEEGINQKYVFHFLSPASYDAFFQRLEDGSLLESFKSRLETILEEKDAEEQAELEIDSEE